MKRNASERLTRRCDACWDWFTYDQFPTDHTRICNGCVDPSERPIEDEDVAWIVGRFGLGKE